jgi:ATP-binding cassette, subfamily B, multidrug efflux pump
LQQENTKSGQIVDFGVLIRLFHFAKPYISKFYSLVFLTLFLSVLGPSRPLIVGYIIDNPITNGDYQGLVNWTIILVVILLLQAFVQFRHTYISGWLGQVIIKDIRVTLYQHLLRLKLKFFDKTPIGRLVTRSISDVETLADVFSQGIAAMISDILQIIVILGAMFYLNWKLTLVCLATFPILIFSTYVFKEKIKVSFNSVRNAVSNLNSFVQEHITGMSVVQIFNAEQREFNKFRKINKEHKKANMNSVMYYSIYFPVAELIQATSIGLIIWYGGKEMFEGTVKYGDLIAFIMYITMFFRPIRMIADRFNTLQLGIVSSYRILKLLDNKEHIADSGDFKPSQFEGNVKFDRVWFAYIDDGYVLKDVSFEVKPGETIALVGATGAGKSSVINLLNRFYEINKGNIFIDGRSIKDYDLEGLRRNIGVVLQDVFLFSDSIENNITLGNQNIEKERIIRAAELVGARKFIERLPGGFDYNVMERGSTLSVGQRQLISFVRAMVYDPKIIVLDEATSSIDTETEEMVHNAIEKMMNGRTSIVIAHRLSTIQNADKIIVLDKGEIKEEGKHDDLLELNGYYSQLHRMQYKEFV